ncbi:hypothetical protein GCM10010336_61800 [Streptomyces goshikiensis]|nr:hypothetical protein GCM10010336_61800 [Streptomyces goshikiensis]
MGPVALRLGLGTRAYDAAFSGLQNPMLSPPADARYELFLLTHGASGRYRAWYSRAVRTNRPGTGRSGG